MTEQEALMLAQAGIDGSGTLLIDADQYTFLSQKNSLELNLIKMSREKSSSVLKSWVII